MYKRFHDRGLPGAFVFLVLIPIVNILPLIELYLLKGMSGDNKYGPDPLA